MTISWDLIRTFEAVAATGSLSGAARRLNMTQPTVGRHIDLLEGKLRMTLFVRGREGMGLTPEGEELVSTAQDMLARANAFERQAAGLDEAASGVVRIAANEIFGALILPALLRPLMDANPAIEIELVVSNSAANLLKRDADIAIRMFRPEQVDLVARRIGSLPLGLFAHESYFADRAIPRTLNDLKDHRVIGFDRDTGLIDTATALGLPLSQSDFTFRCDNNLVHVESIRRGLGIGVTHCGLAAHWPGVTRILPDLPLPALELWLASHSDIRFNKRVRLVLDYLAETLADPYARLATDHSS